MKKSLTIVIAVVLILFCSLVFTACSNRHGMPNGEYCPIDQNDEIISRYPGDTWRIRNSKATTGRGYFSTTYKIVKENNKTYFEWTWNGNTTKFEVEYDEGTKILTIYPLNENGSRIGTERRYLKG